MKKRYLFLTLGLLFATTASAAVLTTLGTDSLKVGLVGWYTFDGQNLIQNVKDTSGQSNTGYLVAAATSSQVVVGKIGQAIALDGSTQKIFAPSFAYSATVSYFTWVKRGTLATQLQAVAAHHTTDGVASDWFIYFGGASATDNQIHIDIPWVLGDVCISNSSIADTTTWHQVGFTRSGSAGSWTYTIYIDGVLDKSCSTATDPTSGSNTLNIGTLSSTNTAIKQTIDDARIYNRALSASEITRLYNLSSGTHINASINPTNLAQGLVGWWTFDGNNLIKNATDSSGQGNTGYWSGGATTTVSGVTGQALSFDGSSQFVSATPSNMPDISGDLTMSIWVKYASAASRAIFFSLSLSAGGNSLDLETGIGPAINAGVWGGGILVGATAPSTNAWHLITYTQSGSTNTMYVDGIQKAQTTTARNTGVPTVMRIASFNAAFPSPYFAGSLDDARIYNRALSPAEITQLYNLGSGVHVNASLPVTTTGLVGWWTFDGNKVSGTSIKDSSGQGNNGTAQNSPTYVAGAIGQATNFNRSGPSWVNFSYNAAIDLTGDMSLGCWVKTTKSSADSGGEGLLAQWDVGANDTYILWFINSDIKFGGTSSGATVYTNGYTTINDGRWHHVFATRSGTTVNIFVDGASKQQTTAAGNAGSSAGTANLNIGNYDSNAFAGGLAASVDDCRIYNRALSPSEVTALFKAGRY